MTHLEELVPEVFYENKNEKCLSMKPCRMVSVLLHFQMENQKSPNLEYDKWKVCNKEKSEENSRLYVRL